jgi:hypothetical protein
MAIKKYIATADNTVTNALKADLTTKGTGSNMGAADILEVFYIAGQTSASAGISSEKSRILVDFNTDQMSTDRTNGLVPASGNVSWYLNLYNAAHAFTLPKNFTLSVLPVSSSWQEGYGLDMSNYSDQTFQGTGSNWIYRGATGDSYTTWTAQGGDFVDNDVMLSASGYASYTASFVDGTENISIDISALVEKWLGGATSNYGLGIVLSGSYETGSKSYYTKKFFSRTSEYFFRRPNIEARWDSSMKDNTANFMQSSSLATGDDNLNTIFLYNYVKGKLQNIPDSPKNTNASIIYASLYSSSTGNIYDKLPLPKGGGVAAAGNTNVTGGIYIGPEGAVAGIYTASVAMSHSLDSGSVYAAWHFNDIVTYHTSSAITVTTLEASNYNPDPEYVTTVEDLKPSYSRKEEARFRLFVRTKNWNPNNYTVMQSTQQTNVVNDAYYSVFRIVDDYEVIPFGTGSATSPQADGSAGSYTRLSYDISGNYFDLSMDLLKAGYEYGLKFAYYINGSYREQKEVFKFKVEE